MCILCPISGFQHCRLSYNHEIILTFEPFGFSFTSSSIVIILPFAFLIFCSVAFENLHAATCTFFVKLPEDKTNPGTSTVSPSATFLSMSDRLTSTLWRVDLDNFSAVSFQIGALTSIHFFLRFTISPCRYGLVGPVLLTIWFHSML